MGLLNLYYTAIIEQVGLSYSPYRKAWLVRRGWSKQRVRPYVKALLEQNVIEKQGGAVWKLTGKKVKNRVWYGGKGAALSFTSGLVNSHGFVVSLKLPVIEWWSWREKKFEGLVFKSVTAGVCSYQQFLLHGWRVRLFSSSAVFIAPRGWRLYS